MVFGGNDRIISAVRGEGELYFEEYCSKCIFDREHSCPIWALHLMHNYEECNKPGSFLHMLIPRRKAPDYGNEECKFFMPAPSMGLPFASGAKP